MIFKKIRYLTFIYTMSALAFLLKIVLPPVTSVTGLIINNGKLLCIDLSYYPGLGLPGGLIEKDEEAFIALEREIKEETGLQITNHTFLGTASAPYRGISSLSLIYKIDVSGDTVDSSEGKIVWLDPTDAVGKLQYPNAQLAVKKFLLTTTDYASTRS